MVHTSRHEQTNDIQIKLPWDKNTARGFVVACVVTFSLLLFTQMFEFEPPIVREKITSIPVELMTLNFGDGDGTGKSKGNLQEEGKAHKGDIPSTNLDDAKIAAKTKVSDSPATAELGESINVVAVNEVESDKALAGEEGGSDAESIGKKDGSPTGRGLGDKGVGKGAGHGFGNIEWGGGGNRKLMNKVTPKFPKNSQFHASMKFKLYVQGNGIVSRVVPLQKSDPELEKEAIRALRQWRFNPLDTEEMMVGTLDLNFVLK
jgi:hypothetical protein